MRNAIGYHCYAGGLACGVAKHFNLVGLGEHDGYGNEVKALNFPDVPLYATYDAWPRTRGRGTQAVPFIFANPPCAIFSAAAAGRKTAWRADPRLQAWADVIRLLPEAQPDVLTLETVLPAWTTGRELINKFASTAASWGYSTTLLFHNARHHGSVQDRKRIFLNFHRVAVTWDDPDFAQHVVLKDVMRKVRVSATTRKRYGEQALLADRHRDLYDATSPGFRLYGTYNKLFPDPERHANGNAVGRPSFLSIRTAWDRPGPVFMGGNHILHPDEPRALYPEEINAYVGFPPEWRWPERYALGKIAVFASQGVSPACGDWLGAGVARSLDRGKRLNRPVYAVVDGLTAAGWDAGPRIISDDPVSLVTPFTADALAKLVPPTERPIKVQHDLPFDGGEPARAALPAAPTVGRPGSGAFIRERLVAGDDTATILTLVRERFPASKAGPSDVAWNRGRLKKEGVEL